MPRVIFNGEPGEVWTNNTGRAQYQFVARLSNTCGLCFQYHLSIASSWPIPLHRGCRCTQVLVAPGADARPFVDFREVLDELGPGQQAAAVGSSNWQLIKSGAVRWEDVVTSTRVRDLREVVSRQKLAVGAMRKAGVSRSVAERAYETVHTPAHELANRRRAELVAKLEKAGLSHEQVGGAVAEKLAARVRIGGEPGKPPKLKPKPSGPRPELEVNSEALAKALGVKPEALVPPRPEVKFGVYGSPAPSTIRIVREVIDSIPAKVKEAFARFGTEIAVGEKMRDVLGNDVADLTPQGWPEGLTWDHSDGGYIAAEKRVAVGERKKDPISGQFAMSTRLKGVLAHETGHGFDYATGSPSGAEEFAKAHDLDAGSISEDARKDLAYYLQQGDLGRQETFAELFAQELGPGTILAKLADHFPRSLEVLRNLLR